MAKKRSSSTYPKKYRRKTKRVRSSPRRRSQMKRTKRRRRTKLTYKNDSMRGGAAAPAVVPPDISLIRAKLGNNLKGDGIGVEPDDPGGLAMAADYIHGVLSSNFKVTDYNSPDKLEKIEELIKLYMDKSEDTRKIHDPLYCLILPYGNRMADEQTWSEWASNIWSGKQPEPTNINVSLVNHLKQELAKDQ